MKKLGYIYELRGLLTLSSPLYAGSLASALLPKIPEQAGDDKTFNIFVAKK